jgi:DNA-binding NarL/FixJ family response regulator
MDILITDDHALYRDGLKLALSGLDEDMRFLDASNGVEAIAIAETHPDLALHLLDLSLPGMDGFDTLSTFRKRFPQVPVAILTASEKQIDVQRALAGGALGFIPKSSDSEIILNAVRLIVAGGIYIPSLLLEMHGITQSPAVLHTHTPALNLTVRQREVLSLLGEGKSNKEIARVLNMAERTVKAHVSAIFQALWVVNRTQAVVVARKMELIS